MEELNRFQKIYFEECEELLEELEAELTDLEVDPENVDALNAVFRAVHTIKGGGGAFGFDRLVAFAHKFENLLDRIRVGELHPTPELAALSIRARDVLADLVSAARDGSMLDAGVEAEILAELSAAAAGGGETVEPAGKAADRKKSISRPATRTSAIYDIRFEPRSEMFYRALDPLLLIRELSDLGKLSVETDVSALPDLDEIVPDAAYLRWRMTLETDAGQSAIEEVFEFVMGDCVFEIVPAGEGAQAIACGGDEEPAPAEPDSGGDGVAISSPEPDGTVSANPTKSDAGAARREPAPTSSIRVDLAKVDRLVNMVGEIVITQTMLAQQAQSFPSGIIPELQRGLDELSQQTRELQDSVMAIRAQPVKSVFARMPRLVREVASATGKKVRLVTRGENTELDMTVIEQLGDPLTHMIRNSIDHGIEPDAERSSAGKPDVAVIHLSAEHRGGNIVIAVSDDGAGIDRERVLAKARERGLLPSGVDLPEEEIDNLIFVPGFSTAQDVSEISGRGVGMDVVRQKIQGLGGRVFVRSTPGVGATFSLVLPLTLAIMDGMIVRVGETPYVLPLTNIIETLRPAPDTLHRVGKERDLLTLRGEIVPLLNLGALLGVPGSRADASPDLVIVVECEGTGKAGFVIDEIMGQQQVVIKAMNDNFEPIAGVAAATILGNGKVALILDVAGLMTLAGANRVAAVDRTAEGCPPWEFH